MQSTQSKDYFDLPPFGRMQITAAHPDARLWFQRGIIWSYSFNHQESIRCFERALAVDPGCPMAHWGIVYALGPNYNKAWGVFDAQDLQATIDRSNGAVKEAKRLAQSGTPLEQALINALQHRCPKEDTPSHDFSACNRAYADAMKEVYDKFGDDHDVAALYADSLMNLTPWQMWDIKSGKPNPKARTLETQEVIERAFTQPGGYEHVGLLHFYIHLMEMSPEPEKALPAAERLRKISADAGHLRHMPSHLDILIGDYRRAIEANTAASKINEKYVTQTGITKDFYTLYRLHDLHSLVYAAMFAGQFKTAMDGVKKMEDCLPEDILHIKSPPMADWLEAFNSVRAHVLIRFGRWRDILELELPKNQELYCVTTATYYYAKGVALAATGKVKESEEQQKLFRAAKGKTPESRMFFPNKSVDILEIADAMLAGELEYRRGNFDEAFAHLRKSVELDDALIYSEPWAWMQPARHALCALLLEQGHLEEATKNYEDDLGLNDALARARQHPLNVWALQGYHECLKKLGRETEARLIKQQLVVAKAFVDVPLVSSCYCRRK